jgi:hypothetical protein
VNLFFDTSTLVKYFHPEVDTAHVIELIENPLHQIWVSDLARIEFISALCCKLRRGDIDNKQLNETLSGFDAEWLQFNHQPLGAAVVAKADKLMRRKAQQYGLRALDVLKVKQSLTFI